MRMHFVYCSVLFVITYGLICRADTGDTIWSQCTDVPFGFITIGDVCVKIIEAEKCSANITMTISGITILKQQLGSNTMVPQVCGAYTLPIVGTKCNICVRFKENPTNSSEQCAFVEGACSVTNLPSSQLGCFSSSALKEIIECQKNRCPNDCSGHGTCDSGICRCEKGYYASDCSSTEPLIEQCTQVDQLAGKVCVRMKFTKECEVTAGIYVGDIALVEQSYEVDSLNVVFNRELCSPEEYFCNACIKWSNLVLNETYAAGCNHLEFKCFSQNYGTYDIGCFEDKNVVPSCFGKCPNNCNNNGLCENGKCICFIEWDGDDCSIPKVPVCEYGCSHGVCRNGACICDKNYDGPDCSSYIAGDSNSDDTRNSKHSPSTALMVLIPIGIIFALLVLVGGAWYYLKKRDKNLNSFNHLDLLVDDSPEENDNHTIN